MYSGWSQEVVCHQIYFVFLLLTQGRGDNLILVRCSAQPLSTTSFQKEKWRRDLHSITPALSVHSYKKKFVAELKVSNIKHGFEGVKYSDFWKGHLFFFLHWRYRRGIEDSISSTASLSQSGGLNELSEGRGWKIDRMVVQCWLKEDERSGAQLLSFYNLVVVSSHELLHSFTAYKIHSYKRPALICIKRHHHYKCWRLQVNT